MIILSVAINITNTHNDTNNPNPNHNHTYNNTNNYQAEGPAARLAAPRRASRAAEPTPRPPGKDNL